MLDQGKQDTALDGLVLLDLPDHDSTEVSHHLEVERLVAMTDLMVWVLDPQKYADAAIHHRFLAPMASHKDVMLVVLNHVDQIPEGRRPAMIEDLRRLLEIDGLGRVPVLAHLRAHGRGDPRAACRDRQAGGRQGDDEEPPRRRRDRCRGPAGHAQRGRRAA